MDPRIPPGIVTATKAPLHDMIDDAASAVVELVEENRQLRASRAMAWILTAVMGAALAALLALS